MKIEKGYECLCALVDVERQAVRVFLDFDLESFPAPAIAFRREGATGDAFAEMVGWKNPVAVMRDVFDAARSLCAEAGVKEVAFAPYCKRRMALYVRMARKAGYEPRLFQWPASRDEGVIIAV